MYQRIRRVYQRIRRVYQRIWRVYQRIRRVFLNPRRVHYLRRHCLRLCLCLRQLCLNPRQFCHNLLQVSHNLQQNHNNQQRVSHTPQHVLHNPQQSHNPPQVSHIPQYDHNPPKPSPIPGNPTTHASRTSQLAASSAHKKSPTLSSMIVRPIPLPDAQSTSTRATRPKSPSSPSLRCRHSPLTPSRSRLFYLPHLFGRWPGFYSFVLYLPRGEMPSAIREYNSMKPTERCSIIFYGYGRSNQYANDFPVNLLRNVGIFSIQTSHFLMLDMDMWMSGSRSRTVPCRHHVQRNQTHSRGSDAGQSILDCNSHCVPEQGVYFEELLVLWRLYSAVPFLPLFSLDH